MWCQHLMWRPPLPSQVIEIKAVCTLKGQGCVEGTVHFVQKKKNGPVVASGAITGLTKGEYGFHVHQPAGNSQGYTSAGPHFDPLLKKKHGEPKDQERSVRDLGNVISGKDGGASVSMEVSLTALSGDHSVTGHTVEVREKPDGLGKGGSEESTQTGNAGHHLACSAVGISK
uniref:superoxide dismutase [Cu-Zn]-like n=1 Tax=Panthera onca TaxID=9690 RepID=UPI0029545A0A|nr:superoxide dismutase [Cu-Zn]-like [Panthera onca]